MKTENGLYKFDIQMFAGTAFVDDDVLPATTQLRIYFDVSAFQNWLESLLNPTTPIYTNGYAISFFTVYYVSSTVYEIRVGSSTAIQVKLATWYLTTETLTWESNYEINGYVDVDISEWTYAQRTITISNPDAVSALSLTYEDVAPPTWTVSFDSNGGSAVSDIEDVEDGATISAPTAPTRTNYTFAGWFKEEALTNAWVFASDTVTADTTLYAKWVQGAFEKLQEFGRQTIDRIDGKASKYPPTNTQDANYTLVLADDGKVILAGHATNAVKVTIPLNSSVEFPTNTEIAIVKYLAGDVTIGTASGATLNGEASTTTFEITDQYGTIAIKKVGTDAWIMTGGFEEVA